MTRPLRVLSWAGAWGAGLRDGVSQPFQDATGVQVEAVRHVGLRLPDGLVHALETRGELPVDVVWCNTSPALRAVKRGWCEPLEGIPGLDELGERARAIELDGWPIAPMYVVHYVLAYQRRLYPTPPESWQVLERAEHARRIVLYPGGNGFYPVAQVMGGGRVGELPDQMDACWAAVTRLRTQLGSRDYSIGLPEDIRSGDIHLRFGCGYGILHPFLFGKIGLVTSSVNIKHTDQ